MRCTTRLGRLVVAAFLCLAAVSQSCESPLAILGPGLVRVELGSASGRAVPSVVSAVELTVKADDMDPLAVALAVPSYAASVEVPAGKARTFSVVAKDTAGVARYAGDASLDVKGGKSVDLAISLAAVYRLTYDGNGAASGTAPADPAYYRAGATATVLGNTGALAMPGRILEGWTENAAGSGAVHKPGDSLTMPASDLTLYAKWVYPTYAITYHLNGGSAHSNPATYTEASLPLTLTPATWGANAFEGWYSDPGLATYVASIPAGTTGDIDLYAGWILPTVSFDPNGGTGSMAPQQAPAGDSLTLASVAFSRPGYAPSGWNTASNGSGTAYGLGATITMPASDTTLYAQWSANSYTVTFDAQGGTPTGTTRSVGFGSAYGTPPGAARTGYTLERWNTASDGSGTDVNGGTALSIPSDHTIYAIWTANSYTVTFDAQGGTTPIPSSLNATFDQPYGALATTTQFGQAFSGWWTGIGGTGTQVLPGTTMTNAGPQMLYAYWQIGNYAVTFNINDGDGGTMADQMIPFGSSQALSANTYWRSGYTFAGWNTAANGSGTPYADAASFTMNIEGQALYAQWTINSYSLSFDANGGFGPVPTGGTYEFEATFTATAPDPTLFGTEVIVGTGITQRFTGWNSASNGSGASYAPGAFGSMTAGDLTLYAQWTSDSSAVGKRGPAGGLVFYDKGSVSEGWRFLEAAPKDRELSIVQWQSTTTSGTITGADSTAIGYGGINTILAANYMTAQAYTGAALTCQGLSFAFNSITYDDWFMPTKDELAQAYTNLKVPGLGSFESNNYWACSESTSSNKGMYAWYQFFINGYQADTFAKTNSASCYVRPVRAFSDTYPTYSVVYYPNGADVGTPPIVLTRYKAGDSLDLSGDNGMTNSGSSPIGWNTLANGSGTSYSIGQAGVTMPSSDLILYAQW